MQLKFTSVMVQDQDQALRFYTEILGFEKMGSLGFCVVTPVYGGGITGEKKRR